MATRKAPHNYFIRCWRVRTSLIGTLTSNGGALHRTPPLPLAGNSSVNSPSKGVEVVDDAVDEDEDRFHVVRNNVEESKHNG